MAENRRAETHASRVEAPDRHASQLSQHSWDNMGSLWQRANSRDSDRLAHEGVIPGVTIDGERKPTKDRVGDKKDMLDFSTTEILHTVGDRPLESRSERVERGGPKTITEKDIQDLARDLKKNLKDLSDAQVVRQASDGMVSPHASPDFVNKVFSVLSKDDIKRVDAAFGGKGVVDAFQKSDAVSDRVKERLAIIGQGADSIKADPKLTLQLAELAIKNGNLNDFTQAFAGSSPEARKAFFANAENNPNLGQQAIDKTFWASSFNRQTATEFARNGRISTETEVSRETGGRTSFTNYEGIEQSLRHLPPAEAQSLAKGARLKDAPADMLTEQQNGDVAAYKQLQGRLKDAAGNNTVRLAYWESLAQNGGQSNRFLDSVASEGGRVWNSNPKSHLHTDWDKQSYDFYNDKQFGDQRRESTRNVLSQFSNSAELIAQFDKKVTAKTYEESLGGDKPPAELTQKTSKPQSGIDAERAKAADESLFAQFRTDLKLKEELSAPVISGVGRLLSNTPYREEQSFQQYTSAVGTALAPGAGWDSLQSAHRAQSDYRESRDAENALETAIVRDGVNGLTTVAGGVLTGGAGFGLALGRAALFRAGTIVTAGAIANPSLKAAGLGRLYDDSAGAVLKDSVEGGLGVFFGGGTLKDLGLSGLQKTVGLTKLSADAFNTIAYPAITNSTFATTSALLDGKDLGSAALNGLEAGLLAPVGVHGGYHINRHLKKVPGLDGSFVTSKPFSVPAHRGALGGASKIEGKLARPQAALGDRMMDNEHDMP